MQCFQFTEAVARYPDSTSRVLAKLDNDSKAKHILTSVATAKENIDPDTVDFCELQSKKK